MKPTSSAITLKVLQQRRRYLRRGGAINAGLGFQRDPGQVSAAIEGELQGLGYAVYIALIAAKTEYALRRLGL